MIIKTQVKHAVVFLYVSQLAVGVCEVLPVLQATQERWSACLVLSSAFGVVIVRMGGHYRQWVVSGIPENGISRCLSVRLL